ncbi:MAG: MFS transporter [Rubrobacter sp.]
MGTTSSVRRVVTASVVGTVIEWYDYFIYGTAAALVFGGLFFPSSDPLVGTLLAFATFGAGFLARPLGGVIFGHYGDRVGRKSMLVLTLLITGVATFLIGCLPTYESIGVLAPILLVTLRLLQGLGLGGEWGGAALMSVEHAPQGRRGFYGSFPQLGVPIGFLLSSGAFLLVNTVLSGVTWGWRVPFLASIVLIAVGLFIRLRIEESPVFKRVRETGTEARMPVLDVLRVYPKQVALAVGASLANQVVGYIVLAYLLSYGTQVLGLSSTVLLVIVSIAAAVCIFFLVGYGALSDRLGRRRVFLGGTTVLAVMSFPFFWLVDTGSVAAIFVAVIIVSTSTQALAGPTSAFFAEMFGTRVRYSGISLGYQLGAIVGGGFAPFIAASLYAATGTSASVSAYMLASCVITFVSVLLISETYQKDIGEVEGEERRLISGSPAERRSPTDPAVG